MDRVFVRVTGRARPRAAPSFGSGLLGLSGRVVWTTADVVRDFWELSGSKRRPLKMILGPPKCPAPLRPHFYFGDAGRRKSRPIFRPDFF
jgi:hypothetical protein